MSTQDILKYCLQDALGIQQQTTFFELLHVLSCLCDNTHSKQGVEKLRTQVNIVCALIERDFPVSRQVSFYSKQNKIMELQEVVIFWKNC